MPTLYHSVYRLSLEQSLRAGTLINAAQIAILIVCALSIDRLGRRRWVTACYVGGAMLTAIVGTLAANSVIAVIALVTLAYGLVSSVNAVLYLYTPEIYPTRMRAVGTGSATCWVRLASVGGQLLVGYVLAIRGPALYSSCSRSSPSSAVRQRR